MYVLNLIFLEELKNKTEHLEELSNKTESMHYFLNTLLLLAFFQAENIKRN